MYMYIEERWNAGIASPVKQPTDREFSAGTVDNSQDAPEKEDD